MKKLKARAAKLRIDLPAIFLALKSGKTPWYSKLLALITIGYALSPIDFIPDFIPILGYLDDLIILPVLIALTVKTIPPEVLAQCKAQAGNMWQNGKPKRWYYALPIVLFWLIVVALIIKAIIK